MHHEQPPPRTGVTDVHSAFLGLVQERYVRGLRTYGTPLQTFNGRDALRDAIEEVIDLGKYLTQEWLERQAMAVRIHDLETELNRLTDQATTYTEEDNT